MGKPLRFLLAVTCLAVLAVIGYWAWQQYEAGRQAERTAVYQRQRDVCLLNVRRRKAPDNEANAADLDFLIKDCIARGLLDAVDVSR